jgi:hypothetical protein
MAGHSLPHGDAVGLGDSVGVLGCGVDGGGVCEGGVVPPFCPLAASAAVSA